MKSSLFSAPQYSNPGGCFGEHSSQLLLTQGVVAMNGDRILSPGVIVVSAALVFLMLAVATLPSGIMAADHPKTVRGYVYDQDGRKVVNAHVTVTMMDGETQISAKTEDSDSNGYFSCNFDNSDWYIGNTIVVSATYGALQATNETPIVADDEFVQWENVTFPYEIPELGNGLFGFLVAGLLLGAISVAALVLIRRKA